MEQVNRALQFYTPDLAEGNRHIIKFFNSPLSPPEEMKSFEGDKLPNLPGDAKTDIEYSLVIADFFLCWLVQTGKIASSSFCRNYPEVMN